MRIMEDTNLAAFMANLKVVSTLQLTKPIAAVHRHSCTKAYDYLILAITALYIVWLVIMLVRAEAHVYRQLKRYLEDFEKQGCQAWQHESTGDPQKDYSLLQRISYQQPEVFWPHLLDHFKVTFAQPPQRSFVLILPFT